jgi:hypothetical protein
MSGYRRAGLRTAHMLAGCHIIRDAEAPCAEESQQAAALLCVRSCGGRERALLLQLVACWDAMSAFISAHYHSPNAYIASPFTTVV